MDTEGRPGSYFAHVLFRDEQQQKTPWPVLDCLKLWAAPGWVCEDSPAIPFLLRPLQSLDEIRAGQPFAVDDRMLLSFLTVPAGGEFHDPRGVLPPRAGGSKSPPPDAKCLSPRWLGCWKLPASATRRCCW